MGASKIGYSVLVIATTNIGSVDFVDSIYEGTIGEVVDAEHLSDNGSSVVLVRFFTPEGFRTWQVSTKSVGPLPLNNQMPVLIERDTTANQLSLAELTARQAAADNSY